MVTPLDQERIMIVRLLLRTLSLQEQYPLEDLQPFHYGKQITVETMVKEVLLAAHQ